MRVRWFGEPWPLGDLRAPICDDDDYRIAAPVGEKCIDCDKPIEADDRGIVMAASPEIGGAFVLVVDGTERTVAANHIDCFINSVVPDLAVKS